MSTGLYSGVSGLAIGSGLWKAFPGLWGGATGLIDLPQTLSLDFLGGTPLDSRITFSRGSQATLTDSTGKITYAPNNVITNSVGPNASVGTAVTMIANGAPDGTSGIRLSKTDATTPRYCNWTTSFTVQGDTGYIASAYFKYDGYDTTVSLEYNNVTHWGKAWVASFNVTSSGITANAPSSCTSGVQSVGNGWFRVWAAFTSGTPSAPSSPTILTRITGGSGTSVLVAWGQIEAVTYQTTPGTYNSTTPKNLLGYTQEFDNAAWTKSNAFVQTNLLTYSEAFDNTSSWTPSNTTVTANSIASPSGTVTADTLTDNNAASQHRIQASGGLVNVTQTQSIYAKAGTHSFIQLLFTSGSGTNGWFTVIADLTNGTITQTGAGSSGTLLSSSITAVGGGWYRITMTGSATTAGPVVRYAMVPTATGNSLGATDGAVSYTGTGTSLYIWGAQLVQGSTAGNYQPTYAAAAAVQYPAPDNSLTADKLVEDTATSTHNIRSTSISLVSGTTYYSSAYVSAAGRTRFQLINFNGSSDVITTFDLSTGSVVSGSGSITSVGGGWFKVSQFFTAGATVSTPYAFQVFLVNTGTTTNYTGDGTSGIYIWGAQLSNSASVDPYVYNPGAAPTSAAYYGPRFDYDPVTLAAKGLLIEEQRTNLLTYSEQFDNAAWSKAESTVTGNAVVSPDGTTVAEKLIPNAASISGRIQQNFTGSAGTTYTLSLYAKQSEFTNCRLYSDDGAANSASVSYNLSTGAVSSPAVVTGTWTSVSTTATNVGNGWYRLTLTWTATSAAPTRVSFWCRDTGNGTSGIYIWGAQLEAGSFATSYIPTVASTVTRSADVATMTGANFSNWYNQNAGTISVQGDIIGYTLNQMIVSFTDGTITNSVQVYNDVSGQIQANAWVGGSVFVSYTQNSSYKYALGLENNNVGASINGGAVVSDLSVGPPVAYNRLNIGSRNGSLVLNGHIRSISYYNTRLGNATLQALTV